MWYISPRFGKLYQEKSGNPEKTFERDNPNYNLPTNIFILAKD
jgi:hypothetical protein